jgi:hypothetical protein
LVIARVSRPRFKGKADLHKKSLHHDVFGDAAICWCPEKTVKLPKVTHTHLPWYLWVPIQTAQLSVATLTLHHFQCCARNVFTLVELMSIAVLLKASIVTAKATWSLFVR